MYCTGSLYPPLSLSAWAFSGGINWASPVPLRLVDDPVCGCFLFFSYRFFFPLRGTGVVLFSLSFCSALQASICCPSVADRKSGMDVHEMFAAAAECVSSPTMLVRRLQHVGRVNAVNAEQQSYDLTAERYDELLVPIHWPARGSSSSITLILSPSTEGREGKSHLQPARSRPHIHASFSRGVLCTGQHINITSMWDFRVAQRPLGSSKRER